MTKTNLNILLSDAGVIDKNFIKTEELNDDIKMKIVKIDGYNYIFDDNGMTIEELKLALLAKQTNDTHSIKNMVTFFTVISVISFFLSVIVLL
jgi:hypothetical protein